MANEIKINLKLDGDKAVEQGLERDAKAADKFGDSLEGAAKDSSFLEKRAGELQGSLKDLFAEFDKTGDKDILKKINLDQRELGQLTRLRKQFSKLLGEMVDDKDVEKVGVKAGGSLAGGLVDSFSKAISAGGSPFIAAVVGAAAAASPFVGAALSAAVVGGVGVGGIAGGIAAAAQDSRVRQEAQQLGKTLSSAVTVIGEPFVGPTIESIRILNKETGGWVGQLKEGLSSVAPVLKPLTEGLDGFVDEVMPGVVKGLESAKPVLRSLANELPKLGEDLSAMFEDMAANPEAAAAAMHDLVTVIGETGRAIGVTTKFLSSYYEVLIKTGEVTTGWANDLPTWVRQISPLTLVADYFDQNSEAMSRAADASHDFRNITEQVTTTEYRFGSALDSTTGELEDQRQAMLNLVETHLDLRRATQDIEEALDSFTESVEENGTTLDISTEKGRNNRDTIEAAIDALQRGSQAAYENAQANGATALEAEEAAKAYRDKYIPALVDGAVKAGFNRAAVLALFEILNKLDGRRIVYYLVQKGGRNIGAKVPGGFIPAGVDDERASGGPVYAGQSYLVGERGPELIQMGSTSGYVHNAQQTAAMMTGATGGASMGRPVVNLVVAPGTGQSMDAMVDFLMPHFLKRIRVDGGDLSVFGAAPAA